MESATTSRRPGEAGPLEPVGVGGTLRIGHRRRERSLAAILRYYIALTKPRIIALLLLTTAATMIVADPSGPGVSAVLWTMLGGYLERLSRDFVMIVIGDHQPPAMVSGEGASWDVPAHIITNRHDVLELFEQRSLVPGDFYVLIPPRDDIHRVRTTSPEARHAPTRRSGRPIGTATSMTAG